MSGRKKDVGRGNERVSPNNEADDSGDTGHVADRPTDRSSDRWIRPAGRRGAGQGGWAVSRPSRVLMTDWKIATRMQQDKEQHAANERTNAGRTATTDRPIDRPTPGRWIRKRTAGQDIECRLEAFDRSLPSPPLSPTASPPPPLPFPAGPGTVRALHRMLAACTNSVVE